jgi:lipid-binding SYLF domain-containing protein
MRKVVATGLLVLAAATAPLSVEATEQSRQEKRAAIDAMAWDTMERLFMENASARALASRAAGWAVFDSFKAAFILSGGGGVGVAVDEGSGARTYMKMGTGGIGLGLGGQSYQVIFLFEDRAALERFVERGWVADASANAVAGTSGRNHDATFSQGVAVFQLTNKGLMAQADISGTKYWKHKKLNR